MENCYVAGNVPNMIYSGLITGTGVETDSVVNCYSLQNTPDMPFTNSLYTNNLSYYGVNNSRCKLNNPIFVEGVYYDELIEALNAWVDANNYTGIYRHWVADTSNVYPTFKPFTQNTNAVNQVIIDTNATFTFDLTGKRIMTDQNTILPEGIYIRNGKKFLKK